MKAGDLHVVKVLKHTLLHKHSHHTRNLKKSLHFLYAGDKTRPELFKLNPTELHDNTKYANLSDQSPNLLDPRNDVRIAEVTVLWIHHE